MKEREGALGKKPYDETQFPSPTKQISGGQNRGRGGKKNSREGLEKKIRGKAVSPPYLEIHSRRENNSRLGEAKEERGEANGGKPEKAKSIKKKAPHLRDQLDKRKGK